MPIEPVDGMEPLPLAGPRDVDLLVERLSSADGGLQQGLADHFGYLAAVAPEWFRPHQERVITELHSRFDANFGDYCALLGGAPDRCVEVVVGRLREHWDFADAWLLAAIGTDAAMAAVAEDVRAGGDQDVYAELGVWVPATGPAQYRFSTQRRAVWVEPVPAGVDPGSVAHPVGLALTDVLADPASSPVTWHYLSLSLAEVPGLPAWPAARAHLVGPREYWDWTLTCRIDGQGRYRDEELDLEEPTPPELVANLLEQERLDGPTVQARLRPYDADLVYCNGHIVSTPNVVGTAGGPPIGIYPNPDCPGCGRLMFHVASVEHHIRYYGDGWRSLFLCEDCQVATVNATGWN